MPLHTFTPTHYFNVLATVPPVLTIAPGDTVQTTAVDAHGFDAARRQVTPPGNPMTGPFFIEGAEPGDTLVVHLDAITPNRTYGWGSTMLAPNVVDPEFVRELPWANAGAATGTSMLRRERQRWSSQRLRAGWCCRWRRCWAALAWPPLMGKRSRLRPLGRRAATWITAAFARA
jgi:hypothetical protein